MSTPATATINLGGTAVGANPSGLAIAGMTSAYQAVSYDDGTGTSSPTGYAAATAGHQTALFLPILVGTNASGLSNAGPIAALTTGSLVAGSGYLPTSGTVVYTVVPLTYASPGPTKVGYGAEATVTVTNGVVASVVLTSPGVGYVAGEVLSADKSHLGGTVTTPFTIPVTSITPVVYTTSILIDGNPVPYTVTVNGNLHGATAVLVSDVVAAINTALTSPTHGTASISGGNLLVTSPTTGTGSSVLMVTGNLFPAMTGFQYISAAVPGAASPTTVTATLNVDGTAYPVSVLTSTLSTFADVVTALNTALGASSPLAVASMGVTPYNVLSVNSYTAGSGYTNGTYYNVPLQNVTVVNPNAQNAQAAYITVAGGIVTAVVLVAREGIGYTSGDVLTALTSNLGGTGSGFTVTLTQTTTYGPDIRITSGETGTPSTVSIVDGTFGSGLFQTLAGYIQIEPAHQGVDEAKKYNAVISVESTQISGVINTLSDVIPGSGYVAGTYYNVPLTGGSGLGAQAKVVVSGITHGTATVPYTASPVVTPLSQVGIAKGAYTFTANVNGAGAVTYTINTDGLDTMTDIAAFMTTALAGNGYVVGPGARVTAMNNTFVFMSPTVGSTSTVVLTIPASSGTDIFGAIYTGISASAGGTSTSVAGTNGVTSVIPTASGTGYVGTTFGDWASTLSPSVVTTPPAPDVLSANAADIGGAVTVAFSVPVLTTSKGFFTATVRETGVVDNTFTAVISGINAVLPVGIAQAAITGGNIVISTVATGPSARIAVADTGALFSSLAQPSNIERLGVKVGGSNYTNGTYVSVPLTGGSGSGATATITVFSGIVNDVIIENNGIGYVVGDVLSATPLTGVFSTTGNGAGFTQAVASVSSDYKVVYSGSTPDAAVPAVYGIGS
jgi:hypothetical protein